MMVQDDSESQITLKVPALQTVSKSKLALVNFTKQSVIAAQTRDTASGTQIQRNDALWVPSAPVMFAGVARGLRDAGRVQ